MIQIFISYRRTDSQAIADRIHDHIAHEFGANNVFQDVEDIPPGVDFREHLAHAVGSCDVLLVIIGKHWLDLTDEQGKRRLDDPSDFVRIEVESGLKREDVLVIPIFVDGATMPSAKSLPPTLRSLTYRNAVIIRHNPYFEHDIERLITQIKSSFLHKKQPPWLPIALVSFTLMAILSIILIISAISGDNDDSEARSSTQDTRPSANVVTSQVTLTSTVPASITPPSSPEFRTSSPTIQYPDGTRFELLYNAASFYIWNPNRTNHTVSALAFQAININGELIGDRFEATAWSVFYPVVESRNCYRIEITRAENYLRPENCQNYNAEVSHTPNDRRSFWKPRDDASYFVVFWGDEEIARCLIDAGFCEIYLPN